MSLSKPQKIIFLILLAVVSVVGGVILGGGFAKDGIGWSFFQTSPKSSQLDYEGAPESPDRAESGEDLPGGWESQTGLIRESLGSPEGTHELIGDDGQVVLYLEAADEKLKISEGMEVEVQGPVKRIENSDFELMTVERVVFR